MRQSMALLALCVGLVQGSIYSQYTLDGPEVTDTFGRTSTTKKLALGSGSNAVCGKSYHMRSGDFISLKEGNGAPTGNVDFSIAGYVKPVTMTRRGRTLFTLGGTDRAQDGTRGNWGAWVVVDRYGRLSVRTPLFGKRASAKLAVGVWHQVVLTYTAAETMLRLWVDDKLVLSKRATMDLQQSSRYGGMAIGEFHLGGTRRSRDGEFFVDHVSFADHVMTPQEARAPCLGETETGAPATNTPRTSVPATEAPRTSAPPTQAPRTSVPETQAPATSAPATRAPRTQAPHTPAPRTSTPATRTPSPSAPSSSAAVCAQRGAVCGVVRAQDGTTVQCGSCAAGMVCSFNRCEARCALTDIGQGPFDASLFAYVPLEFSYEDLSAHAHAVSAELFPTDRREQEFPYESVTDMTSRTVSVDFGALSAGPGGVTLSLKVQPHTAGQTGVLLQSEAVTVAEDAGRVSVAVRAAGGAEVAVEHTTALSHRHCNHVAVVVAADGAVAVYVNGVAAGGAPVSVSGTMQLGGVLSVPQHPGKVWDVRVYSRALGAAEVEALGNRCGAVGTSSLVVPDATMPNFLCGVYQCIYWPEGVTDTTQDSFEYQLSGHDMTWEHNVMETGMYVHGALCAEYAKPRQVLLTDGYRRSWVSKFNFGKAWNQYVLHENFHAYQKRAQGSTKFLAESTASWGAFSQKPTAYDTILGMYTLQPQLALWTTQSSTFADGIVDIGKGGHQYGAAIWEWFVTHHVLGDDFWVGKVYNRARLGLAPLSGAPAEGMYNALAEAGYDMREVFSDFAARVTTWDVDYEETFRASEEGSFRRLKGNNKNNKEDPVADEEVDNKVAVFYGAGGTDGAWVSVPGRYMIGDWAFNAYEVSGVATGTHYTVGVVPSAANPAYSEFRAQAVVHNTATGERRYVRLPAAVAGTGGKAVTATVRVGAGETLYLVVANTPATQFRDFLAYSYDYLIQAGGAPPVPVPVTAAPTPLPTPIPSTTAPATRVPATQPPATEAPRTAVPSTSAPVAATSVPATETPPTTNPPRVFLMAGQSNMVGHGKTADLKNYLSLRTELLETRSDVFAKSIIERSRGTGGLGPFYGASFGPELGFGHVLGDALTEDVYLFKASKGGTQIARADHWSPTGDADNLYAQMVAGFAAFRATLPADHVVSGFVWSQGYNDAFSDADANGYEAALTKLIAAVRAEVGVPALPVVVVQGNDNQGVRGGVIRRAQAAVATADAHADWVPSDDLYHYYHYDGGSMVAIGERAGRAMLPLLGVSAAGAFPDVYVAVLGAVLQVGAAEGVLANDRGVAAQGAQAVVTAAPAHGTLRLGASGGFVYTPAPAFVGRDTFSYTVMQNGVAGGAAEVEVWVETQDAAAEHLILHYAFESAGVPVSPSASASAPSVVHDTTKHVQAYVDPSGVSVGVPGGVSGNCAELSGTKGAWNNGHMKVQMSPMPAFLLLLEDDVTVSTWVKIAAGGDVGEMPIFSNAGRPTSPGLTLLTAGAGKSFKTVVYARDGKKVTVAGNTAHPIDDGEWHHVAAVVSRATDTATNYVDGVAVATASIAGVVGLFEEGYYTRFGGVAWLGKYNKFVGHMDEMRVYRAALSPSQVAQLYADRM